MTLSGCARRGVREWIEMSQRGQDLWGDERLSTGCMSWGGERGGVRMAANARALDLSDAKVDCQDGEQ